MITFLLLFCVLSQLQNVMFFHQKCVKFRHLNRRNYFHPHKIASRVRHDQIEAYIFQELYFNLMTGTSQWSSKEGNFQLGHHLPSPPMPAKVKLPKWMVSTWRMTSLLMDNSMWLCQEWVTPIGSRCSSLLQNHSLKTKRTRKTRLQMTVICLWRMLCTKKSFLNFGTEWKIYCDISIQ